ncbi:MAG: hypothetical protein GEV28_08875 [Actinophytocola sp.]|nr:hypothetical protein [Actinophytocola sp.]
MLISRAWVLEQDGRVVVEGRHDDVAFVGFGVAGAQVIGSPAGVRIGRGRRSPEAACVAGAVAVAGPAGEFGSRGGFAGTTALDRGGVDHPGSAPG